MFSTFIILSIINPYDHEAEMDIDEMMAAESGETLTFFEMLGEYILMGLKLRLLLQQCLLVSLP